MAREGRSLAEHMIKQISSKENRNIEYMNLVGIVRKVHDPMELKESEYLQIIELSDSSSAIRAILWNENTGLNINKSQLDTESIQTKPQKWLSTLKSKRVCFSF